MVSDKNYILITENDRGAYEVKSAFNPEETLEILGDVSDMIREVQRDIERRENEKELKEEMEKIERMEKH